MKFFGSLIVSIFFLLSVFSCELPKKESADSNQPLATGAGANASQNAAIVDGKAIAMDTLNKAVATKLYRIEERIYSMKQAALDEMIDEMILEEEAKKKNLTVEQLITEAAQNIAVDQKEFGEFFERFKGRLAGTDEEKKTRLTEIFKRKKEREVRDDFVGKLRASHSIEVFLNPPELPLAEVEATDDSPYWGPKDAPVTLIEFSDFKCPYCKRAVQTMKDLHEKFKDELKIVFRHFPIPSHEGAFEAAEASMCANDQGKFWEFHEKLFDIKGKYDKDAFANLAKETGLDVKDFTKCYDSHKYKDKVEQDRADGEKAGVSGTPAFYVNKKMVSGARDVEYFSDLIKRELAKK